MNSRDLSFVLCAMAYILLSAGMVVVDSMEINIPIVETAKPIVEEQERPDVYGLVYVHHQTLKTSLETTPVFYNVELKNLEEYNCLMYATESLGRYYITAYNHLETGSKITASGKTCHEGLITTCAADPRYHKFGEYLEIDGRLYVVEDTGSAVKRRHIDLYFANYKSMAKYGSNYQEIYKVSWPFGKPKQN